MPLEGMWPVACRLTRFSRCWTRQQPYLHTNGDALRHNDELRRHVLDVYERICVGLYDYENASELEREQQFWKQRLAGANVAFSPIGPEGKRSGKSIGIPKALVPTDSRMSIPDLTYDNAPCHRPLIRMIIRHDGEMCHCCEDTVGAFQLGNVHESSLEDLWYAPRHVQIVHDLVAGHRAKYALCRNCPQTPTGRPQPGADAVEISPRHYRGE